MSNIKDELTSVTHTRSCVVCGKGIQDMRKATAVPTGNDTYAIMHDKCVHALNEQYAYEIVKPAIDQAISKAASPKQANGIDWKSRYDALVEAIGDASRRESE